MTSRAAEMTAMTITCVLPTKLARAADGGRAACGLGTTEAAIDNLIRIPRLRNQRLRLLKSDPDPELLAEVAEQLRVIEIQTADTQRHAPRRGNG